MFFEIAGDKRADLARMAGSSARRAKPWQGEMSGRRRRRGAVNTVGIVGIEPIGPFGQH
jgi:hypothetical protein